MLPATPEPGEGLADLAASTDAVVRATALDVLRDLRLGTVAGFTAGLRDADHRVRIGAIRGLVSLDEADLIATVAGDASREARVWAARGLGVVGKPSPALLTLAADADPLVRAAALESSGATGAPLAAEAVLGMLDAAWEVRVGAVRCLAAADPEVAVGPVSAALADGNLDVRKAAVLALTGWASRPEVDAALRTVLGDPDADVRSYARRALAA